MSRRKTTKRAYPAESRPEDDLSPTRGAAASCSGHLGNARACLGQLLFLACGLSVIVLAFYILERHQPFYFTQDDNYCQSLPVIVESGRSFFSGVFPQWNPHQLLGAPTACLGVYGLTYPPTYAAYAVARWVLHNEFLTLEVLAAFHLLAGYFLAYWAARTWRVSPPLAVAVALSYVLSGYMLIAGRSWGNMLAAMAWLPTLSVSLGILVHRPVSWRWAILTGLAVGVMFHAGFVQIWVYALGFLCLAALLFVWAREVPVQRALWLMPALLVGLAISMPLLFVQMRFGAGVMRMHNELGIEPKGLLAMLLPYPFVSLRGQATPNDPFAVYTGQFYFSGGLFVLASLLGVAGFARGKWTRTRVAQNYCLWFAVLSLIFAFGDRAYLWPLLCKLPWFGKFRNAERFLALFVFFTSLGGGIVLTRMFEKTRWSLAGKITVLLVVGVSMIYHSSIAKSSFWYFPDAPYLPLPDRLEVALRPVDPVRPQRIRSLMPLEPIPFRIPGPNYALGMDQNFASGYGLLALNGYDPLVYGHTFAIQYLFEKAAKHGSAWQDAASAIAAEAVNRDEVCRAYGVRWLILHGKLAPLFEAYFPDLKGRRPAAVHVWPVDDPLPLAYAESNPASGLPIQFDGKGTRVDTSSIPQGGTLIVNVLAWPDFVVRGDGKRLSFTPDEWGRMKVELPPGTVNVRAEYAPPWCNGFAIALVLIGFSGVAIVFLSRHDERSGTDKNG